MSGSTRANELITPSHERGAELLHGLWCGAAGGLLGAGAMILFADAWSWWAGTRASQLGTPEEAEAAGKVVDIVTRRVLNARLRRKQRLRAATGFHFAFGALAGAAYGAMAETVPEVTSGAGAPFGALEWLFGNKFTAPRVGLLQARDRYSRQERIQTLASHVVFGIVTEVTRRTLRNRRRS